MKNKKPNRQLEFVIEEISRLQKRIYNDCYREMGVNSSMISSLIYLSREPDGLIQSELADRLEIGKAATGTLIDKLEMANLITKQSCDNDRRVWILNISDEGRAMVANAEKKTADVRRFFRKNTLKDERVKTAKVLDTMRSNLKLWQESQNGKAIDDRGRKYNRK